MAAESAGRRVGALRSTWTVAKKDLLAELRTKEALNASASFALVILLLFSFAIDPTSEQTRDIAGGLLWLVFAFAGALILNRSFARELTNDCLDALIASPAPPAALFMGKCLANFVLLAAVEAIALPVFGIFYSVRWTQQWPELALVCVLATWGITVVGTTFSALTVNLRLREVMLPVLVYPLLVPCLMAAIQLTLPLVVGDPVGKDTQVYWRLLVSFDVVFTALSVALIDTVLVG